MSVTYPPCLIQDEWMPGKEQVICWISDICFVFWYHWVYCPINISWFSVKSLYFYFIDFVYHIPMAFNWAMICTEIFNNLVLYNGVHFSSGQHLIYITIHITNMLVISQPDFSLISATSVWKVWLRLFAWCGYLHFSLNGLL